VPIVTNDFGASSPYTYCEGSITNNPALPTFTTAITPANRITWQWQNDNPAIGLAMSGSTATIANFIAANGQGIPITANITVTPYYRGLVSTCQGIDSTFQIKINPRPDFTVVHPDAICKGDSVDFAANATIYIQNMVPDTGCTIAFFSDRTCNTAVTKVAPTVTTTYFARVSSTYAGCNSIVKEIIVTVKPLPQLTSAIAATVCSGEPFAYEATGDLSSISYQWSRAAVTGIGNAATTGYGATIRETLIDTIGTAVNVIYKFTLASAGCTDTANVTVTVNPTPVLNNIPSDNDRTICSEDTFTWNAPSSNVATAIIRWSRLDNNQIDEPGRSNEQGDISEKLTNLGAAPVIVTYEFTLSNAGCEHTEIVRVTVNPTPYINSSLDPVELCNGGTFNYNTTTAVRNTTFAWSRASTGAYGNPAASGTNGHIVDTLNNTGTTDIIATYIIIATSADGCTFTDSIEVTVHPQVTITSVTPPEICSEDFFNYMITSNIASANFTWRRQANANIQQPISNGSSNDIYEQLTIRNSTSPVDVIYIVRAEANGCMTSPTQFTLTVNPKPTLQMITATPMQLAVNNIDTARATANGTGTIISWTSSNTNVATVTMTNDPEYAQIVAVGQGIAEITVVDTNASGCIGEITFIVNVEAAHTAVLTLANNAPSEICSDGATTLEVTINGGRPPFTVYYSRQTDGAAFVAQTPLTNVGSSNHRFTVQPAANATDSLVLTIYRLDSVKESGPQDVTVIPSEVTITVNPVPNVSTVFASPYTYCEGTVVNNLPAFTSNAKPANRVTWQWENNNPAIGVGMSGITSSIAAFIAANGQGAQITGDITVTPSYRGVQVTCPGTSETFQIIVNPKPDFTVVHPEAICKNDSVDLIGNDTVYVQNIVPNGCTIEFFTNRACTPANKITDKVSPNVTTTYFVRVTSGSGADCHSAVKEIVVTVKPLPQLTSALAATVCSGEQFAYEAIADLSGTSYEWTREAVTGIDNPTTTGYGSTIRETLVDTTGSPVTVKYAIKMTTAGCEKTDTVRVIVNPMPVLNNIPADSARTICSESAFVWNTPTSNVSTANIRWSRLDNNQISEPGRSNVSGAINEILTNLGVTPVTVTYEFTLSNAGCERTELVRVVVNPTPVLSSQLYAGDICSGNRFNYTARSATRNVTFSCERRPNANITPAPAASGTTGSISEILTNISANPIVVLYDITLTANGCSNTETVEVTVNPIPQLDQTTLDAGTICSGDAFIFQLESATQNTNYSWMRLVNTQIAEAPSIGSLIMISEVLTNRGNTPTEVRYKVITEANGCRNTGDTVKVTVNPLPQITIPTPTPISLTVNNDRSVEAIIPVDCEATWSSSNINVATVTRDAVDFNKAVVHGVGQGLAVGLITVRDTLTGCESSLPFTINVDAEQVAQLQVPTGYVSQVCNGDSTMLEISMSGGSVPFAFEYSDGTTTFYDTAYQGNYSFTITPQINNGNSALTTTYTLLSVIDGTGQTLSIVGRPVRVVTNPVATVSNIAILGDTICEGQLERIARFETNVTPANKVRFQWENDNPTIGLGISGNSNIPVFVATNGYGAAISGTVTVYPVYIDAVSCPGTVDSLKIKINPKPDFVVVNPDAICEGESFDLAANTMDLIQGVTPSITDCTTQYFAERTCLNSVDVVSPTITTTYYVQLVTLAGCESTVKEVVVSVNPVPEVDTVLNQMVCNQESINIVFTGNQPGTVYRWAKSGTINANIEGLAASGTGILNAARLRNNSTDLQEQEITVIPELTGGRGNITCIGDPMTFKIEVNPTPVLNSAAVLTPICSESTFKHRPTTLTAGATIYWEREEHPLIAEASASGVITATDSIDEVLTNIGSTTATVRYRILLDINGCINEQHISVKVYPTPYLVSTMDAGDICSGSFFSYRAESAVRNATFEWRWLDNYNIIVPISQIGHGAVIYAALTNLTSAPVPVQYEVTATANGCIHIDTITVYVGPKLGLTSTLTPPDICSEEYFIYDAVSDVPVQYTWDREFNQNINPPVNNGIHARIAERLVNLSDTAEHILYNITQTTDKGCQLTQQITFDVNPLPAITVSETSVTIAQGGIRAITVTEPTPGNGTVSSSDPTIVSVAFDNVSQLVIEAVAIGYSEITYATFDANGCESEVVIPVFVTPAPLGTLDAIGTTTVCSADSTELQITDILYGKAPWTVEINYAGSVVPNSVVTINNVMELPYIVTVQLPANNTQDAFVKTFSIVKITDSEGSERTSHLGRIRVTVAPVPTVDAVANQEICNGGASDPVYFSGAATDFRWRIDRNVGLPLFGEGNIPSEVLTHEEATAVNAVVKTVPMFIIGTTTCAGDTGTFTIVVNPMPKVNPINNITLCHDAVLNVTPAGAAATKFVCTTMTAIGMAAEVTVTAGNNLTFTAQNTTNVPITATITVLPVYVSGTQECYGTTTEFTITVNPIPAVNATLDMTFCEEYEVNTINFTGNVAGTVYTWQHIAGDAITGVSSTGVNQIPPFVAYNLADTMLTSTFEVIASYTNNGITCSLNRDTFDINIYPKPSIEPILDYEYCTNVLADSIPFVGNSTLNIYDWRIVTGPNIGLPVTYGTSTGIAEFTTENPNSYMRTTLFEVTPRIDGTACMGNPVNFSITVNPIALLSSPLRNDSLCSGEMFTYNATSTSNNVLFSWKRPEIGGMDSISDQGTFIHEHLHNNTDAPIEVPYIITLSYEGCNNTDTTFVVVKPTPVILLDSSYFHACQAELTVNLTYTTDRPTLPLNYSIIFDDNARAVGFANTVGWNPVTTSGIITVDVPSPVPAGRYMGTLFIESYGCAASTNYMFVILVAPATVITKEPQAEIMMCEGSGSLQMAVEAIGEALTYQWYHNGTAINGATSPEYHLDLPTSAHYGDYYAIVNGVCGADTSAIAHVVPNAAVIYLMGDDMLFVSGLDTNGTNLQFVTYQWYKLNENTGKFLPISDGANAQYYYDPNTIDGTYMVEITYINGSSFISCPHSFVPAPPAKLLQLYPNPVIHGDMFHILLGDDVNAEDWSRMTVEVMTTKGQVMQKIVPTAQVIDIRMTLPASVYVIRLTKANGEVSIHKLIVN
jgi:hypothetical protein